MGQYYNPSIATRNLVWLIDAANFRSYPGSGNTWFNLNLSNQNDITHTNSPTFSSVGATSYFTYNGTTQYGQNASIINPVLIQGPITVNAIFLPSSTTATHNVIALQAGVSNSLQIGYRTDVTSGSVWKNGGTSLVTYPYAGIGTVWHVAYTCDGSNGSKIYVNGALWTSSSTATNTGSVTNISIATFNGSGSELLNGRVYYASIHDAVHTEDEIAQTYHALKKRWGYSGVGTAMADLLPEGGFPRPGDLGGGGGGGPE